MAEPDQRSNSNTSHSTVLKYSPIITKVDAPLEDSGLDKKENEKKIEETPVFKVCSPTLHSNNVFKRPLSTPLKSSILKPPQVNIASSSGATSTKIFTLNPPKLNPFVKKSSQEETQEKKVENTNGETPKFVSLLTENKVENSSDKSTPISSTTPLATSSISPTSFVFGQNLQERVVAGENKNEEPEPSTSLNTNGTTDMLFSNALKNDMKPNSNISKENKSLSESAREYEESRAVKRKYDEVEVKTGEEEETNIVCISCKLFAFDGSTGNWQERGRGTLRLNDFEVDGRTQSRLVFRTSGSFRVILNTKVFAKMTAEKASDKSIRLTALDANGEIKVFLVMASVEDSKLLHQSLEQRIKLEAELTVQEKS